MIVIKNKSLLKKLSFIEKILKDYGDDFKIKFARHTGKRLDDK